MEEINSEAEEHQQVGNCNGSDKTNKSQNCSTQFEKSCPKNERAKNARIIFPFVLFPLNFAEFKIDSTQT